MTVPTGSPDGQAGTQQHGQVIVGKFSAAIAAGVTVLYSGPSAAWASFQIRVTTQTFGCVFSVAWFADSALTQGVGTDTWNVNHSTGLSAIYPVEAPFCKISVNNDTTTAAITGTIYVIGTQINAEVIKYPVTAQSLLLTNIAVLASATNSYHPSFIARGGGLFTFTPSDALGKLNVAIFAEDDGFNHLGTLYTLTGPTAPVSVLLSFPDQPLGVNVTNTDGAGPHSFGLALVIPGES